MDFVEQRQSNILIELGVLEAANLLDVLTEVTAQWHLLDTVPLGPSFEEVDELCRSLLVIVNKAVI